MSRVVSIEPGTAADADAVIDCWVDLAGDQRAHGSHLLAAPNRSVARDAVVRHAVAGTLLVARADGDGESDGDGTDETPAGGDGDGDDLVGFVTFQPETGAYEQDVARGIVENLYVRPADRGAGVGRSLLAAAERELTERGVEVVALEVLAGNAAARRFYERAGYEVHRLELERRIDGDGSASGATDTHSRERE